MSDIKLEAAENNYHRYNYNNYYGGGKDNDAYLSKRNSYGYDDHYGYGGEQDEVSRQDHYGYDDHGGSHSGYGHHGGHKEDCCPLVVKPLVVLSLLGGLALAAALLNVAITMMLGGRRKRSANGDVTRVRTVQVQMEDMINAGMKHDVKRCDVL